MSTDVKLLVPLFQVLLSYDRPECNGVPMWRRHVAYPKAAKAQPQWPGSFDMSSRRRILRKSVTQKRPVSSDESGSSGPPRHSGNRAKRAPITTRPLRGTRQGDRAEVSPVGQRTTTSTYPILRL